MGKLFIVPTPIGNLQDITLRALDILKEADVIYAEDTRKSGILLKHFEIQSKLMPHHKFNEHKTLEACINTIESHKVVALITDAGTPAISDPGFLLVRECLSKGVEVECLPGATAFVPALVNSGLPNDRFCFEGFLPQKKGRHTKIESLKEEERTLIFYESPHRIVKLLQQLLESWGERRASVSRELTKMYEETVRGTFSELIEYFGNKTVKGEIVLVVEGKSVRKAKDDSFDSAD